MKARQVKKNKANKKTQYNARVLLFRKLDDDEVKDFHYLKANNKEEFKKKYHGYVLGKKR